MNWEILNLSGQQKMIKLGCWNTHCQECMFWRKRCAWNIFFVLRRTKGQSIQSHKGLLEEIRHLIPRNLQSSQQKSRIEVRWSREDLWKKLLSNWMNSVPCMEDPQISENVTPAETLWVCNERERGRMK